MYKNKISKIILSLSALLIAASVYAAKPDPFRDLLVKLGLLQKQVDALAEQIEPKFGGISAFSECFPNGQSSTTPSVILTANSTSTSATCDTKGKAKTLSFLFQYGSASTSPGFGTTSPRFTWEYEFSHDGGTWFRENISDLQAVGLNGRNHGVGTTTHGVNIGLEPVGDASGASIATTSVAIKIDNVLARYIRIRFASNVARANIWSVLTRQEDQN